MIGFLLRWTTATHNTVLTSVAGGFFNAVGAVLRALGKVCWEAALLTLVTTARMGCGKNGIGFGPVTDGV